MKRCFHFLFIIFIALLAVRPALAAERVKSFDVIIELKQDSDLRITEQITYDFDNLQRHGIYRDIPYKYKARGGNYTLEISDILVRDLSGNSLTTQISNQAGSKHIRIGDADKYVTGQQTYVISYTARRAINYFDDHDELYWNVTGNEWTVPIDQAFVLVLLPDPVASTDLQYSCFKGLVGSNTSCELAPSLASGKLTTDLSFSQQDLSSGEGLTIVLGLPKGILYEPTWAEQAGRKVLDNIILLLPLAVLIFLYRRWQIYGRDPKGRGTIIPQYDPPDDLTPAEMGTLYDEYVNNYDVSADIVFWQLAVI